MIHRSFRFLLLASAPVLSGCWLFGVDQGYALDDVDSGSHWMTYDAARRGGLLLRGEGAKVLAEPAPDAIASTAISFVAEAASKAQQVDGKVDVEYTRTVAELAGRGQTVLVVREALYRLNELFLNGALGKEPVMVAQLFQSSMDAVVMLAFAAVLDATGAEEVAKAQAERLTKATLEAAVARDLVAAIQAEQAAGIPDSDAAKGAVSRLALRAPTEFGTLAPGASPEQVQARLAEVLERARQQQAAAEAAVVDARAELGKVLGSVGALGTALSLRR